MTTFKQRHWTECVTLMGEHFARSHVPRSSTAILLHIDFLSRFCKWMSIRRDQFTCHLTLHRRRSTIQRSWASEPTPCVTIFQSTGFSQLVPKQVNFCRRFLWSCFLFMWLEKMSTDRFNIQIFYFVFPKLNLKTNHIYYFPNNWHTIRKFCLWMHENTFTQEQNCS